MRRLRVCSPELARQFNFLPYQPTASVLVYPPLPRSYCVYREMTSEEAVLVSADNLYSLPRPVPQILLAARIHQSWLEASTGVYLADNTIADPPARSVMCTVLMITS